MLCVVTMHGNITEKIAGGRISFFCEYAVSWENRERLGRFSRRNNWILLVAFQNEFEKRLSGVDTAAFPQAGEGLTNLTRSLSFKTGGVFSVILWSLTETSYLGKIRFSWEHRHFSVLQRPLLYHIPMTLREQLPVLSASVKSAAYLNRNDYTTCWLLEKFFWTINTDSEYRHWLAA